MTGMTLDVVINEALDRWIKDNVRTFKLGGSEVHIIALECVPEGEIWMMTRDQRAVLKLDARKAAL